MNCSNLIIGGLLLSFLAGPAWAEGDKVQRKVGADGVPVISIKGTKPAPTAKPAETKREEPAKPQKEWKVYDLEADTPAEDSKPTVIVVSSPPPIAPNNSGSYGYGYGYGNNYYNNGYGTYNPGYGYFGSYGYPYVGVGGFYANYQNRSVNYCPRPGGFNGYRGRGRCR